MFLQIRLAPEDRWAFSFFWWTDGDLSQDPDVYQWNVHPFGAVSSPFCANFALRRTADDLKSHSNERAVDAIRREFYVDDFLGSTKTIQEAAYVVTELRHLLNQRGFKLVKWISNVDEVLQDVPEEEKSESCLAFPPDAQWQRTLGIRWQIASDSFKFRVADPKSVISKRSILSYVASIFDPLGFVAPLVLPGKQILQHLVRKGFRWDTQLPDSHCKRWTEWCKQIKSAENLEVPRCLGIGSETVDPPEPHVFSDASEVGYGAVAYLRFIRDHGHAGCTLIMGKSRVV